MKFGDEPRPTTLPGTVRRAQQLRACAVCGSKSVRAERVGPADWVGVCRTCGQSRLLIDEPGWVGRAACGDAPDPELWFTDATLDEATDVCQGCPVWAACLLEAIYEREPVGVWGGLTPDERNSLRRVLRATTAPRSRASAGALTDRSKGGDEGADPRLAAATA